MPDLATASYRHHDDITNRDPGSIEGEAARLSQYIQGEISVYVKAKKVGG